MKSSPSLAPTSCSVATASRGLHLANHFVVPEEGKSLSLGHTHCMGGVLSLRALEKINHKAMCQSA